MLFLMFRLERQRYALPLSSVERVDRVVYLTPLPQAPSIVMGCVNLHGRIIPVINIRKRFGLAEPEIQLSDSLIFAGTGTRTVALLAEAVDGVLDQPSEKVVAANAILSNTPYIEGVTKLEDGLVLIHDLATLLSLDESRTLDESVRLAESQAPTGNTAR